MTTEQANLWAVSPSVNPNIPLLERHIRKLKSAKAPLGVRQEAAMWAKFYLSAISKTLDEYAGIK